MEKFYLSLCRGLANCEAGRASLQRSEPCFFLAHPDYNLSEREYRKIYPNLLSLEHGLQ